MSLLPELGTALLLAALVISVAQAGLWVATGWRYYRQILPALSLSACLVLSAGFGLLLYAFTISDFSVSAVYMHSHSLKPMLYKITGTWGNHEGSILLWCWIMTLYGAALSLRSKPLALPTRAMALHVMGAMQAAFIGYTLFTSNPFQPMFPVPSEGTGLNPLLQDVGLAAHPPLLYLGYVGFSAAFALAMAALIRQDVTPDFARVLHPWVMLPWAFLTLGIGLGSWWAYRELGWGGWWFWDPVENASLLPWLSATALFHSNLVMMKRGNLQRWVLLLALVTFILSLLGTFLVRSGILTSVHSFANDPTRGLAILAMIAVITAFGLFTYFRHARHIVPNSTIPLWSREMAMLVNNILLMTILVTILLAMLYPLLIEALGGRLLTIGTAYYNHSFALLSVPLVLACAISTFLVWGNRPTRRKMHRSLRLGILTFIPTVLATLLVTDGNLLFLGGMWCGLWLFLAMLYDIIERKRNGIAWHVILSPMVIGHTGLAIFILAVTLHGTFRQQSEFVIAPGDTHQFGSYTLTLGALQFGRGDNYVTRQGVVEVTRENTSLQLYPEERYFPVEDQFTTEASIDSFLTHDLYATLKRLPDIPGATQPTSANALLGFHVNPGMVWIWVGFVVVSIAGIMAAIRKR